MTEGEVRTVRDATALRALAHPLRLRILGALRVHGPATASELGRRLGESSGSISYHARQLAAHGFVEDAPEAGTRRERWWRAVDRGTEWTTGTDDDAELDAAAALTAQVMREHAAWAESWLAELTSWPATWRRAAAVGDHLLRLTPAQVLALGEEVEALITRYRAAQADEDDADAETVATVFHAFPTRTFG
jgi:DNA-binding transcriptional ArsR family regulator